MKDFKGIIKNKKTMLLVGILVLCVVGGSVFAVTRKSAKASVEENRGAAVTKIIRQDLTKSISVSGTIASVAAYPVSGEITNVKVKELNVKVGDSVKAGDVLVKLDDTTLSKNLRNAQASAGITGQQGKISVSEAERNYNHTVASNDTAVNRATEGLNAARADVEVKKQKLAEAQQAYDLLLASAEATDEAKSAAKTTLDAAQETLNTANHAVTSAQQALDDANATRAKGNADSADALENSKLSAQNSANTANEAVTQAKDQLEKATIKASADGVVTALNVKAGDIYSGGTLLVIQDVSGYKVSASLDQYDIPDVVFGMRALISTDTTGEEKMTGSVSFVSPTPAEQNSKTADGTTVMTTSTGYPIEITIDNPSERLRIGMNVKVTIELSSVKNILSVPSNAVQQDESGNTYVEVCEDEDEDGKSDSDERRKVLVTQGLNNGYYVEISGKDLTEKMSVILPTEDAEDSSENMESFLF